MFQRNENSISEFISSLIFICILILESSMQSRPPSADNAKACKCLGSKCVICNDDENGGSCRFWSMPFHSLTCLLCRHRHRRHRITLLFLTSVTDLITMSFHLTEIDSSNIIRDLFSLDRLAHITIRRSEPPQFNIPAWYE